MARKYEAAWLNEPIPALAGHMPRECSNDPTRRPDLIRLLDSFPQDTGRPGTISPASLRAALGLSWVTPTSSPRCEPGRMATC